MTKNSFAELLLEQPMMKLIYALSVSASPRSLRELADMTSLSVSTVQDVIRRLKNAKLINSNSNGNKIYFSLECNKEELDLIKKITNLAVKARMINEAKKYSLKTKKLTSWIDETLIAIRKAKYVR